jgi:methylmalonyl-CoA mutase N-terminal domain/subunit
VTDEPELTIPLLRVGEDVDREQRQGLADLRARREQGQCDTRLAALRDACATGKNVMPYILACARAYCTLYEIRAAMEEVFGAYREPVFF